MRTLMILAVTGLVACTGSDDKADTGAPADTDTAGDTDTDTAVDTDTSTDTDTADTSIDTDTAAGCETDICATYGAAVPDVASEITNRAAADPMFAADFAPLVARGPEAVQAFKDSLTAFISDAYGCSTGLYTGPSMVDAHTGMGITQDEYDAFIVLIAGVLADAGVPQTDIEECFAPPLVDPAFSSTIVGH
ncbi:MAG: hypothetical protein ACK4YP_27130 [Myxococcota bacterium]